MADHDAATTWAMQNPQDPRSQDIVAKAWASSHMDDPRSSDILSRLNSRYTKDSKAPVTPDQQIEHQVNPYDIATTQSVANKNNPFEHDPELAKLNDQMTQATSPEGVNQIGANMLLPSAGAVLAKGVGALGRIGIGAGIGVAQHSGSMEDMATGAIAGGGLGAGLEGLQSLLGAGSRIGSVVSKASQLKAGSPDLQDQASSQIEKAMQGLRGAASPTDAQTYAKQRTSFLPSLDASGAGVDQPGLDYLQKLTKNPISSLTTSNVDKRANLNRLADASDSDLGDFADQLRSALKLSKGPITGSPQLVKQGLKGASSTISGPSGAINDPRTLSSILGLLK